MVWLPRSTTRQVGVEMRMKSNEYQLWNDMVAQYMGWGVRKNGSSLASQGCVLSVIVNRKV